MGGPGSGGRNIRRSGTVESVKRLSVGKLARHGVFCDGWSGSWGWSDQVGARTGSIWIRGGCDCAHLEFSVRRGDEPWTKVAQTIALTRQPRSYGGAQTYFVCPRCARNVCHVFLGATRFACRRCHDLTYASSREALRDRCTRRARTLRARIGSPLGLEDVVIRPRHMRHATFEKIATRIHEAEAEAMDDILGVLNRLGAKVRSKQPARRASRRSFW